MTRKIFEEWLNEWNSKLSKENRKIALIIDNCPSHTNLVQFSNIEISYLPVNSTAILQPMDQGIISLAKATYRRLLSEKLMNSIELNISLNNFYSKLLC